MKIDMSKLEKLLGEKKAPKAQKPAEPNKVDELAKALGQDVAKTLGLLGEIEDNLHKLVMGLQGMLSAAIGFANVGRSVDEVLEIVGEEWNKIVDGFDDKADTKLSRSDFRDRYVLILQKCVEIARNAAIED